MDISKWNAIMKSFQDLMGYQKGINDVKGRYQQELDRHLNAKYNEGYLDGQRNGYTEEDMKKQYQKGYVAGQNSKAIQKSEPSDITQDTQHYPLGSSNTITVNSSSTAQYIHFNNGTGSLSFRIKRQ